MKASFENQIVKIGDETNFASNEKSQNVLDTATFDFTSIGLDLNLNAKVPVNLTLKEMNEYLHSLEDKT